MYLFSVYYQFTNNYYSAFNIENIIQYDERAYMHHILYEDTLP